MPEFLNGIGFSLLGWLGLEDDLVASMSLIVAGTVMHTAIAFETVGTLLNGVITEPVRSLFHRWSQQLIYGVVCGIMDVCIWVAILNFIVPQIESKGWLALLVTFCAFIGPPYILPSIALLFCNALTKRRLFGIQR